jgi:hypothetical protein
MLIRLYDLKKKANSINQEEVTIAEFEITHPGQAPLIAIYDDVYYSYTGTEREDPPFGTKGEVKVWQKYRPVPAVTLDAGSKIVND